ncbi:MAG: MATE family efflux transporter [Deltaproteobacteria bacterium]|nr:MATE family efflux transporter [Deltaproteobacteria bacterium]
MLALPMVLEMMMESVFAVADVFFVARLGAGAVAAVGLTESLLTVIYALAVGLSMPAAAMVARRIGEKNPEGAARAAVQGIGASLAVAIVLGITGSLLAPHLLTLMGADAAVLETGTNYARILLASNCVIFMLFLNNAIFRGAGDAAIAMRVLWIANAINLVLDPCLIFGLGPFPELGLTGAAIATTIGRGTAVLLQLYWLTNGSRRIHIQRRHITFDPTILLRLLKLSIGGVAQNLVATASWIGLVRITAAFGSSAVAGYTIAIRLIIFALLPSWGMSNAAATLVGQNLGAKKPDRAEKSVWLSGFYNMLFLGSVAVIFILFASPLIKLFTQDPAVIPIATDGLRIISFGFIFYAWGMVMVQSFNGAGDTMTPTWVNLFCFWAVQIPLAWWLAKPMGVGPQGVFWAAAISYSLEAVVGLLLFRRGTWKKQVV